MIGTCGLLRSPTQREIDTLMQHELFVGLLDMRLVHKAQVHRMGHDQEVRACGGDHASLPGSQALGREQD